MELIAQQVLSSSAVSMTFSSIPQTFRDLVVVISSQQVSGTGRTEFRLNNDGNTEYLNVSAEGTGTAATSIAGANTYFYVNLQNGDLGTSRSTTIINVLNYSLTNQHKVALSRGGSTDGNRAVGMNAHRWPSNAAISSILIGTSGTYAAGSTFTLYGIAA